MVRSNRTYERRHQTYVDVSAWLQRQKFMLNRVGQAGRAGAPAETGVRRFHRRTQPAYSRRPRRASELTRDDRSRAADDQFRSLVPSARRHRRLLPYFVELIDSFRASLFLSITARERKTTDLLPGQRVVSWKPLELARFSGAWSGCGQ
jgi:hypothetical protein